MPKSALAVRRPPAPAGWQSWASLAVCGTLCLATAAGGVLCLWVHAARGSERVLAPAGIALLASAAVQLRLSGMGIRNRRIFTDQAPFRQLGFWRLFFAGVFFTYLAALFVGPLEYVVCAWIAGVSLWYAVMLLPLAAPPVVVESWRKWTQGRLVRRIGWIVPAAILLAVCGEAGLQARRVALEGGWFARAVNAPAPEAFADVQNSSASSDELDLSFAQSSSGRFRVAILGQQAALSGAKASGYLARLQHIVPGLEIIPLEVSQPWSIRSADDVSQRLADLRPDLALAVFSVCENLAHEPATQSLFDWRQLELVRLVGGNNLAARDTGFASSQTTDKGFESYLGAMGPQLVACRTPIDDAMRARWQRTFSALDNVVAGCRERRIPVGLVLVPSQFQVNRTLCETLARRMGYSAEQIDVDLPQRNLAGFAEHRQVPLLDLLPHLRLQRESIYLPGAATWNERGNTAAAAAIGGWLESRYGGQLALAAELSSAP